MAAPELRLALLERDARLATFARQNVAANGLDERAFVAEADLLSALSCRAAGLESEGASLVLTNPPFLFPGSARVSPDPGKASAHMIGPGGLGAWICACMALLAPGGTFLMIHRADALGEALQALGPVAGAVVVLPVLPRAERPASRILIRALKGRRTPLTLAPPLILHERDNRFTARAAALHRGEARIDWDALSGG